LKTINYISLNLLKILKNIKKLKKVLENKKNILYYLLRLNLFKGAKNSTKVTVLLPFPRPLRFLAIKTPFLFILSSGRAS